MYEVFEHTADLGLRVRGATQEELFIEAARGLVSLLVANPQDIKLVHQRSLRIEGDQLDYLFFDWLNELLYLFETERVLLNDFTLTFDEQGLSADCRGEVLDSARHIMEHEVKAITYHNLKVEHQDDGWLAEVIVDI